MFTDDDEPVKYSKITKFRFHNPIENFEVTVMNLKCKHNTL